MVRISKFTGGHGFGCGALHFYLFSPQSKVPRPNPLREWLLFVIINATCFNSREVLADYTPPPFIGPKHTAFYEFPGVRLPCPNTSESGCSRPRFVLSPLYSENFAHSGSDIQDQKWARRHFSTVSEYRKAYRKHWTYSSAAVSSESN
jgi:hypothetical protein